MTMNKQELAQATATVAGVSNTDVEKVLDAFQKVVIEELTKEGGKITWTGFISFETGIRNARVGRNPQTGAQIEIPSARVPKIKAGKKLKDAVNQ